MKDYKLIVYELNELPRRLIDYYVKLKPNSNFSRLIKKGLILNTKSFDDGELHPWSTWPTVHRGVNNNIHNIRFINQDLEFSKNYPPIWELLLESKKKIGIFGSLQSYPPINNKNVEFYLPDTFAPNSLAYPKEIMKFQDFNLNLVSENKAISRRIKKSQIFTFLKLLIQNTISKRSALTCFAQVAKEFFNSKYKKRRSMIQSVISFDLYFKFLEKTNTDFSTYFTNHLAGMMHRYWKDLFPQDFGMSFKDVDKFNTKSIIKAMDISDYQIGKLLSYSNKKGYDLWLLTSMGQKAIDRGKYIPELVLKELSILLKIVGLESKDYKLLPAMQPDICIEAKDLKSLNKLRKNIEAIKYSNGTNIFKEIYEPVGLRLNLSVIRSNSILKTNLVNVNKKNYNFSDIGFEKINRDIGTGYHTADGVMIVYGEKSTN